MSYSGPPGAQNPSHHALPPRPPPSKPSGFKPAFSQGPPRSSYATTSAAPLSYSSAPSHAPPPSYGAPPSAAVYGAGPQPPAISGAARPYGQPAPYNNNYNYPQQPAYSQPQAPVAPVQAAASYYGAPAANTYAAAPQIQNPFPLPGQQQSGAEFDPEMAAQIAQWQSAYMPKDPSDPSAKTARAAPSAAASTTYTAAASDATDSHAAGTAEDKKKTVYREGGGKKWQDDSLLEWDPAHLRLFVGNLAGETTDESLLKAFARWKSVQKAKVVRDKRTTKSKGFGFVSFSDPDDFFQAAKEMNGKYIQSHPVVVHKAKTEVKPVVLKDDRRNHKNKKKDRNDKKKSGSGGGAQDSAAAYEPHLGPMSGGGVTKPGQKTRGGLKLLG